MGPNLSNVVHDTPWLKRSMQKPYFRHWGWQKTCRPSPWDFEQQKASTEGFAKRALWILAFFRRVRGFTARFLLSSLGGEPRRRQDRRAWPGDRGDFLTRHINLPRDRQPNVARCKCIELHGTEVIALYKEEKPEADSRYGSHSAIRWNTR